MYDWWNEQFVEEITQAVILVHVVAKVATRITNVHYGTAMDWELMHTS